MANAVLHRVWEHSQLRGAARCLMLLLADVADQRGVAYPGKSFIADKIKESEDYTDKLIEKAVEAGELFKIAGKGRGHVTRFAVLCGLNDLQIAQIKGVLQDPFSIPQKGHPSTPIPEEKRGKVIPIKGVLPSDKRGTLLDAKQVTFEAYECPETPLVKNEIHHDPDHDPSPTMQTGDGGDDAFYRALRERKVGKAKAREIARLGGNQAAILSAIDRRPNPDDPYSLGRVILDILDGVITTPARASPSAPLIATQPHLADPAEASAAIQKALAERTRPDAVPRTTDEPGSGARNPWRTPQ